MEQKKYTFSTSSYSTDLIYASVTHVEKITTGKNVIYITDSNLFKLHSEFFKSSKHIVIPAGEENKNEQTLYSIIQQLINFNADRNTFLVGVGGGMVSDITGYAASIYMRGIQFGFVPTTLLAMVDASIGGKNGVNFGLYKNMIGAIRQPQFILFDEALLKTLPKEEWINGFAEIIKYGCIKDKALFEKLAQHDLAYYISNDAEMAKVIRQCAEIKMQIVLEDEHENGDRKLLNFGHTFAHAIEKLYELPHGKAVAIGMVKAAKISESQTGFNKTEILKHILTSYSLPLKIEYDKDKIVEIMSMDKKKDGKGINYILLKEIGNASVENIDLETLKSFF